MNNYNEISQQDKIYISFDLNQIDTISFTNPSTLTSLIGGWGCGYVGVPKNSVLYGLDYDELYTLIPDLDVHGGVTFSDSAMKLRLNLPELFSKFIKENYWLFGFDTMHYGDTLYTWNEHAVKAETKRFKKQIDDFILNEKSQS